MLNIEASTGEVKVLPLLVGNVKNIIEQFPLLNDKTYIEWNNSSVEIVDALSKRIKASQKKRVTTNTLSKELDIRLPKVKRNITQKEKDLFIKKSYGDISKYFEEGLSRLKSHHEGIDTDFTEIHKFKFISKIYLDGKIKNECKIWMGGPISNGISYFEGRHLDFNNDSSCSDWLSVEDNGSSIFLKPSGMNMFGSSGKSELTSGLEAAEYFWRRFISSLE